jgi:hypothetical protein
MKNVSLQSESRLAEAPESILKPGAPVKVPHRGKMVSGKVVRYDNGKPHFSPFYIVDVGEYASVHVPAHVIVGKQSGLAEATDPPMFAVVAIADDPTPEWKRRPGSPSRKVVWQMWGLEKKETPLAAKVAREKHPEAVISVENAAGTIVKVYKPGQTITETGTPTDMANKLRAFDTDTLEKLLDMPSSDTRQQELIKQELHRRGLYHLTQPMREAEQESLPFDPSMSRPKQMGLPKAWLLKMHRQNEQNKNHTGNVLLLIRLMGTPQENLLAQKIADALERGDDPMKYKNLLLRAETLHDKYYRELMSLDENAQDSEYGMYYGDDDEDEDMGFEVVFDDDEVAEDDDQSMMLAQLDAIRHRSGVLHQALQQIEIDDVPAWIQDKVSVADHSMNAILDYFMFETKTLKEAEEKANAKREIAWFLQPAHVVAKMLGGSGYAPVGTKAEDIVNNAILAFLRGSHTTESWKMAGAALNTVRDIAGVEWNPSLIKPEIAKAMGITEPKAAEQPEPEPKPEPEPEPKAEPEPKEKPEPTPTKKEVPAEKPAPETSDKDSDEKMKKPADKTSPESANESMEIEIKVGTPMKNVTPEQEKEAALEFAGAVCPGMTPNGVTPEQIINNAVSVWFYRHPVPLDAELKTLGKALAVINTLGIEWDHHLVPAPYLSALALPTVKVTTLTDDDTTKVGKKIDSLEHILLDL